MSLMQSNPSSGVVVAFRGPVIGFAEPDWQGDADYVGLLDAIDLDSLTADLAAQIEDGARKGWLNAYYARRAAFDLQSIRSQIDRERRRPVSESTEADLRAILSRADRLSRCLASARLMD